MSDVAVIVDGVQLPAHRLILAQRSEYFDAMFESGMIEATSNRIEVRETSIKSFKLVLRWIYTGKTDLISIDNAFEVIRLAHMYQIKQLVNEAVDCFMKNCTIENVCLILNEAVLLSLDELIDFLIERVNTSPINVLKHETFKQLSTDALNVILTRCVMAVSNDDICQSVDNWMKANPTRFADFPNVLKNMSLTTLSQDIVHKVINKNIAVPKYGVSVVAGGRTSFFTGREGMLIHYNWNSQGIIIDLGRRYMLNFIKMMLVNCQFSYFIDVYNDTQGNWTRVIDHSKYPCRSLQNLYFETQPVRYIRICCTSSSGGLDKPFKIDPETTLAIPSDNVALAKNNALIIAGSSEPPNALIDGIQDYNGSNCFTWHRIGKPGIIVQLPQPYLLDSMKLLLWDGIYSYNIAVSTDNVKWTRVFSEKEVSSWREIRFKKQPVVFIKITGTYNSAFNVFRCVHLECPAITK
uniref:BTB domain-containing protein n=1 Tax=Panagrellus redivivus TaxID=6233 RepID=A0A7E4ZRH4_PANRE